MKIRFETIEFERAHGRRPRGTGAWAFCPARAYGEPNYLDACFWSNGSYAAAKLKAAEHFQALGERDIIVCS